MAESTHLVEIVPIILEKHENADTLSIARVYNYTVVVKTADWVGIDKAAYVCPDSVVPNKPEYAWLNPNGPLDARHRRITARKFRGIWSMGLLLPAPKGSKIGDDVAKQLDITHYEPPIKHSKLNQGEARKAPKGVKVPHYDLETWYRHGDRYIEGEMVWISEKLHGTSARFIYIPHSTGIKKVINKIKRFFGRDTGEGMYVGSRNVWRKPQYKGEYDKYKKTDQENAKHCEKINMTNPWWAVVDKYPQIAAFCKTNPCCVLYGEIYGDIQKLTYGAKENEFFFAAYDVYDNKKKYWWNYDAIRDAMGIFHIPMVPFISLMPYNAEEVKVLADGNSLIPNANHLREGIVLCAVPDRFDPCGGRMKMKIVSNKYLEWAKNHE